MNHHQESQKALKQMELELMSLPTQTKQQLSNLVRNYKSDLDNYLRKINKAEQSLNERNVLFEKEPVCL